MRMANSAVDSGIYEPLSANDGYASTDQRCMNCEKKNIALRALDSPSGRTNRQLHYHPHKAVLDHVCMEEDTATGNKLLRKLNSLKNFFPSITETDSVASPKSSAVAKRIDVGSRDEEDKRNEEKKYGRHQHYHIHTHHHYPNQKTRTYTKTITKSPSVIRDDAGWKPGPAIEYPPGNGIPFRAASRAAQRIARESISELPGTHKDSVSSRKLSNNSRKSSTGPPGTTESLPRIDTAPSRKGSREEEKRKNSRKESKQVRPVTAKRKLTYTTRKITPPKRRVSNPKRKITPPKKLSNTSNPVTSTDLPSSSRKESRPRTAKNRRKTVKSAPIKKSATSRKRTATKSAKNRLKPGNEQNFLIHSENDLASKIRQSREKKGVYPPIKLGVDDNDEDSPTLTSYPNIRDRVDIYIGPHPPSAPSKSGEEGANTPRARWFQDPDNKKPSVDVINRLSLMPDHPLETTTRQYDSR